jgi:hypothetical protein
MGAGCIFGLVFGVTWVYASQVHSRLTKIRELLAHPEDVEKAHEAIAERVGQLTLEATNENGKRTYLAHGKVDFFGGEDLAHSGGAGGPDGPNVYAFDSSGWRLRNVQS